MTEISSSPSPKISCIVNPQAANKKWQRRKNIKKYLRRNLPCDIIDFQESKQHTIELAKKLSLDHDVMVAVGGDGTVADVIQGIIEAKKGNQVALAILPLGSGNAFRKSLRIPKNFKKALDLIQEGKTKEIDLIMIEGKTAGFASIGATAKISQKKLQYNIPGLWGHLLAARIMPRLPRRESEIELLEGLDDAGQPFHKKTFRLKFFDCVIGKTNYFGYNWKVAPLAKIDDGFLDITFFKTKAIKYLFMFPLTYFGLSQKFQKHFKAKKMILRGKKLPIQYNGEFLAEREEIQIKVLPRALRVIGSGA
ncbi:MAG: diacylglycerol/lipid kinase family protein [Candidatus Aminicenantes bacterium]